VRHSCLVIAALVAAVAVLCGCSSEGPVQPAASSRPGFEGAVYSGQTATISEGTPGNEEYRVFSQGASSFVSVASVRSNAERRGNAFCERKGKTMNSLQETTSKPPHILGNFPRVEIIFECIDKPGLPGAPPSDPKYAKLVDLKKLLDGGVITQAEFEAEKAKILSQP
jgi:hypothetical protein